MLLQHVPDWGEHLVRYYGWYSNRARGTRKAGKADPEAPDSVIEGVPEQVDPEISRAARAAWARLIKTVYEADPLRCPHFGGEMRVLSVIKEAAVIERILRHMGNRDHAGSEAPLSVKCLRREIFQYSAWRLRRACYPMASTVVLPPVPTGF
jgi:hypothetical protein